ncbi:hypothetical protein GF367_02645 [Candidatus Woesearchaeota archaeon]|nr:hypothetical protein [Candidatus Woesearchaeota archaeon]
MVRKRKPVKKRTKKASKRREQERSANPATSLVIAVLVVLAVIVGFAYGPTWFAHRPPEDLLLYNNYEFIQNDDGSWYVRVMVNERPYAVVVHHHPVAVDTIPVHPQAVRVIYNLSNKAFAGEDVHLSIAMDPEGSGALAVAGVEVAKVTGEKFDIFRIPTSAAFTRSTSKTGGQVPVVRCDAATPEHGVIWVKTGEKSFVSTLAENPYCVVLQGSSANETVKVADRFVYALFNVIPAS